MISGLYMYLYNPDIFYHFSRTSKYGRSLSKVSEGAMLSPFPIHQLHTCNSSGVADIYG